MSDIRLAALAAQCSDNLLYIARMDTYEVLYMNEKLMEVLGLESDDAYKGRKCYELLQGTDIPCAFCTNERLLKEDVIRWDYYNEKLKRHYSNVDRMLWHDGQCLRMELATDITDEIKKQKELEYKLGVEETLVECIHVLSDYSDVELAINRLLEIIAAYYQGDRGYIFEINYDKGDFSNTYEWCSGQTAAAIGKLQHVPLREIEEWMQAFEDQGEFYIDSLTCDLNHNTAQSKMLSIQQIDGLIAAPLMKNGKVVGFLGVDNPKAHTKQLSLIKSITCFIQEDLEKRELMNKLERTSYMDMLTQVYNRNKYAQVLKDLNRRSIRSIGVIYLDMNGLKIANDTYGHDYGDYLIKQSAALLKEYFEGNIFRLGGDEFLVLCVDMEREVFENHVETLRQGADLNPLIDVSIGATWSDNPSDLESHILLADELMYVEKQSYYKANLAGEYNRSRMMAAELLDSIRRGDFEVYLQPKISLSDQQLVGAEALIRKHGANGEVVLPNQFLPMYETERIIRHVDLYVLETVCKTLMHWQEKNYPMIHISINLSRITLLENNIVATIRDICDQYQVDTSYIGIEMSESVGEIQSDILERLMKQFKLSGFSISLDDFGSQYSNLAILSSMDFDHLKLDKNLVKNIEGNEKSQIIIKSVIDLCKQLNGTTTVAEGVENEGQLRMLFESNCDAGQGYLFSKPLTIEAFSRSYLDREM